MSLSALQRIMDKFREDFYVTWACRMRWWMTRAAWFGPIKSLKKLYIKKDNKVEISEGTYLKGKIYKGGDFTPKSFVTYFGKATDTTDSENVIKWAN